MGDSWVVQLLTPTGVLLTEKLAEITVYILAALASADEPNESSWLSSKTRRWRRRSEEWRFA